MLIYYTDFEVFHSPTKNVVLKACFIFLDIDICRFEPCQNGATCTNQIGGYKCDCVQGFTGEKCEKGW